MKLAEISSEIRTLIEGAEDGELQENLEARLDALQISFQDKMDGIVCKLWELSCVAENYRSQAERLKKKAITSEKAQEWLKGYVMKCMRDVGVSKVITPMGSISMYSTGREKVVLAEGAEIPEKFRRTEIKQVTTLDREKVLEAYRRGEALPESITIVVPDAVRVG